MKNIAVFYVAVLIPIPLIIYSFSFDNLLLAFYALALYALAYRPVIDYLRLLSKGVSKEPFWKLYIPLFRVKYFRELYM